MRILSIADFGRSLVNGMTNAVISLAKSQRALGNEIMVGATSKHKLIEGERILCFNSIKKFKSCVKTFNPEIVVFNSFYDPLHPIFAIYLRKKRIPYIIMFHGGASKFNIKKNFFKKKIANYLLFNYYVRKASAVSYLNDKERDNSIFKKINTKSIIIPNGINPSEEIHRSFSINRKINISFISRLDFYGKGLDVMCDVLEKIYNSPYKNKVEFTFYGNTYNNETIAKITKYSSISNYMGPAYGIDKKKALINSDLFILPSRSEGMPLGVLEALSYGIPCIVTPQTNMGEIIDNNACGWVIDLDSKKITNLIFKIIDTYPIENTRLTINAINTAHKYNWSNIAKQSLVEYSRIIADTVSKSLAE